MPITQLFSVRDFPAVIQANDVQALRENSRPEELRDFVGGYIGFDDRARHALSTSLSSLAGNRGGAFFLNGVFGSGKSHFLGLLTLLCDGAGHEYFVATHPHLAPLLGEFPRFFTVHFSLDEYDATARGLEEIVHTEIASEWKRRFGQNIDEINLPTSGTRGEYFHALETALQERGCDAVFIAIDELSLFLSAKEHRALQADAAFLQFLGQRAQRSKQCPLHVFAALQKSVEAIGEIENYSLLQIRDRFTTLPLSLAHLPSLIGHRLIQVEDANLLQSVCRDSYDQMLRALPRFDFGRREWQELYPFHPATIRLLERAVTRFFSRTRSAALFCAGSAKSFRSENDARVRVLPAALFDYFAPEIEGHPDLRAQAAVWENWRESYRELARDEQEANILLDLMKTLLLFKICGQSADAIQLANAMALDIGLPDDSHYDYIRLLLERVRTRGSHLAIERHSQSIGNDEDSTDNSLRDRYSVDVGTRIGELTQRYTSNALAGLEVGDERIASTVLLACQDEDYPLAALPGTREYSAYWLHAPRHFAVELCHDFAPDAALQNRIATLGQPGTREEILLLIRPPFLENESEAARSALLESSARLIDDERFRAALVLWTPRLPTGDETALAREATAQALLESDPQLQDNRRGRAVLNHVKEDAAQRQSRLSGLARRLLQEGSLQTAAGQVIEASELAGSGSWQSTLEAIAGFILPHVYPRFSELAPRARVLTPSNVEALCLETLRRPADAPFFAPSHERVVRALAAPLGVANSDSGRWKIAVGRDEVVEEVLSGPGSMSTLPELAARLQSSEWGLKGGQIALLICALLRTGRLVALDAKGRALLPKEIGMPLSRSVHRLALGQLIGSDDWQKVLRIVEILTNEKLGAASFESQEKAKTLLLAWKESTQPAAELAKARVAQLQRALGHSTVQWVRTENLLRALATILESLSDAREILARASTIETDGLPEILRDWETLQDRLAAAPSTLLEAQRTLSSAKLIVPASLKPLREKLLARLTEGEAILEDAELPAMAVQWRAEYSLAYRQWHATEHDGARWNALRQLSASDAWRALLRIGNLKSRSFADVSALKDALKNAFSKQCPRDGTLLPGEVVCNLCGLRFEERIPLPDVANFNAEIDKAMSKFHRALREPSPNEYLSRRDEASSLFEWSGDANALLPLLNDELLALLEKAFAPRRRAQRSVADLQKLWQGCLTREDFTRTFEQWLEGDDRPGGDDEIELVG